jgi:hypothetical protein
MGGSIRGETNSPPMNSRMSRPRFAFLGVSFSKYSGIGIARTSTSKTMLMPVWLSKDSTRTSGVREPKA